MAERRYQQEYECEFVDAVDGVVRRCAGEEGDHARVKPLKFD